MEDIRLRQQAARDDDAVHEAILGDLKNLWVALPGIIKSDSNGHIATALSAINLPVVQLDGSIKNVPFPDLDTSPVHYPGGGGVTHTHPVKKGDEGLVIFSSRAQDEWHQKGGVQDPIDSRTHHLADSRWMPGGRSDPRKLNPPASTSSQQNRSDDGKHVMDVHPQNGISHASSVKILQNVGGTGDDGAGTVHLVGKILKNAKLLLFNSMTHPQLPPPGQTIANRKQVATKPLGAIGPQSNQIASIMSNVFNTNAGVVMANPVANALAAFTSQATGTLTTMANSAFGGGNAVSTALSGVVSTAASNVQTNTDLMSGVTMPTTGQLGLNDVLGHAASLSGFFGSTTPPTAVALGTVLAPLDPNQIVSLQARMTTIVSNAIAFGDPTGGAATLTSQIAGGLNTLITNAHNAIGALQTAAPVLNLILAAAASNFSLDPNEAQVGAAILSPTLVPLVTFLAQVFEATGADSTAISSFPDSTVDQPGATGAF